MNPEKSGDTAPPSLFRVGGRASHGPPDDLRMLSGLDPRADGLRASSKRSQKEGGLIRALVGGALVVGMAGWWSFAHTDATFESIAPTTLNSAQAPTVRTGQRTTGGDVTVAFSAAEASASAAATIETVILQPRSAADATASFANADAAASASAPAPAAETPFAKEQAAATSLSRNAVAYAARSARPAMAPPSRPAAKPGSTRLAITSKSAAPALAGQDSDLELMTALVAHLDDSTQSNIGSLGNREGHRAAKAPRTFAQLVRRCKKFDATQAAHCREQICEGYWGKAQACPARAAPSERLRRH